MEEAIHETNKPSLFSSHLKMKKWRNNECKGDTLDCAVVRIHFVQFQDSTRQDLARQFNDTINALLLHTLSDFSEENTTTQSIDQLAQQFLDGYDEENRLSPSYPWNMDISIDLIHQTPHTITIQEASSSYTGGAHPNTYVSYHNYLSNTAKLLSIDDIIINRDELLKVAEKAFRQANDMTAGDDFYEKGFEMDSLFVLSQNFALTKDGLDFLYNPYEIAPYSMGTIEFSIPYADLENILKPAFILK